MPKHNNYRDFVPPTWFKFPIVMLTRKLYKCAGWHIVNRNKDMWVLQTPEGKIRPDLPITFGKTSLVAVVREIIDEYRMLKLSVTEIENENGKVHT